MIPNISNEAMFCYPVRRLILYTSSKAIFLTIIAFLPSETSNICHLATVLTLLTFNSTASSI